MVITIPSNASLRFLFRQFVEIPGEEADVEQRVSNFRAGVKFMPNARELAKQVRGLARRHDSVVIQMGFISKDLLDMTAMEDMEGLEETTEFRRVDLLVDGEEYVLVLPRPEGSLKH